MLDPDIVVLEYDSEGVKASGVIRTGPGRLYSLFGFNNKASAQYLQVFDALAVPADGAVPRLPPLYVASLTSFYYDFGEVGAGFTIGLCWSNSSALAQKTIGSADCWVHAT